VDVADIRSELQLPASVISDTDIHYAINKVGVVDINLVCAEVLRMVLRKYRGKIRYKIGRYEEWIDPKSIRQEICNYVAKSSNLAVDDVFVTEDAKFNGDI